MKYIFLITLLSVFATSAQKKVIITPTNKIAFDKAKVKYRSGLLEDTLSIIKKEKKLTLPINTKEPIVLTDSLVEVGDPDEREYNYYGQFKNEGFYLVGVRYWENYEFFLIDKKNGEQTSLWYFPELSPKSGFFANTSLPYGMEGQTNGLQIWKIDNGKLIKYFEIDQDKWIPFKIYWESEKSLIVKVVEKEKFDYFGSNKQPEYSYLLVNIK
jgi:hypothetical protein